MSAAVTSSRQVQIPPPKSLEPYFKDPEEWGLDEPRWYNHQVLGIRWMMTKRSVLLNDDMGLGKSMQALATFCADIKMGKNVGHDRFPRLLVVCPGTLKRNWGHEIRQFTRLNAVVLEGSPTKREKQLEEFEKLADPKVLILNYELVSRYIDRINSYQFDMAIFDEAHMLKTPTAQRTINCRKIQSRRSLMLTGTPMVHNVTDLWPSLDRCMPGRFGSFEQFEQRYAVIGKVRGRRRVKGIKNREELMEKMSNCVLARKKEDELDLPGVQRIMRITGMTALQERYYRQLERDMMSFYNQGDESDNPVLMESAATCFLKMLQLCGTTTALGESKDESEKLSLATEDALEILDGDNHVVVFTRWRKVHESFVKRVENDGRFPVYSLHGDIPEPKRQGIVDEWSKGEPGVLVCMYQVAAVGLNLVAARHMLRLDRTFAAATNRQAEDRLNRIGADLQHKIQMFDYLVSDSVEEAVESIVKSKAKMAKDLSYSPVEMMQLVLQERGAR